MRSTNTILWMSVPAVVEVRPQRSSFSEMDKGLELKKTMNPVLNIGAWNVRTMMLERETRKFRAGNEKE